MSLLLVVGLVVQGIAPLRKSDLVRLLSGSVMTQQEIAQLVRRNCLSFDPTERDRRDFRRLGAEAAVVAAMDGCARRAARAPAPAPPVRTPPPPPLSRPAPHPSPERSGFVAGGGQSGAAGTRLPRALVFEVRDSAGAALGGQAVTFTGINARIEPGSLATDAEGRADARIFRVLRIAQDSVTGTVALKPEQAGTTSLAVIANGLRQYLTVTVPPGAAPGKTDCP